MKYFVYCRKSSEENSRQTQSLETQQRILIDLATKLKLEIVDIIRESKSAKDDHNRPLFTSMLERITNGEANGILIVHTDRLARNFIDAGYIIKFLESGVLKEVRTPSSVFNNVPSLLYMGFDFVFAAHYSRDLSVKVKAGNETKLLKGEYPTYAPIGYINIRPGKGIEPDPIRAPFISKAFELYATGEYSLKKLNENLMNDGFRSRKGGKKSDSSLHRILTNPEYYGVIRRKGKLYPGKHRPLVSQAIFNQVQDIIHGRGRPRKQKHNFTYRDFLTCDVCGCKVTAGISKGKYIYYRCTNGKDKCDQHKTYWKKDHVKDEFEQFFTQFTLDPVLAEKSFKLYREQKLSSSGYKKHSQTAIKEQLNALSQRLIRLENMYLEDRIVSDRFDEKKLAIENETAQLKVLLKQKRQRETGTTLELLSELKNQATQLSTIFKNGDDQVRRDLIRSVLWNSNFKDGKITSTRLNKLWKPLENLNKTTDLEKWRRGWDSNPRSLAASVFETDAIDHYATSPLE